jgi:hypothetical protein
MHILLAYIDPGSGSLIIQAVIASIIAIPFFFRHQIGRLTKAVRRQPDPESTTVASSAADDHAG